MESSLYHVLLDKWERALAAHDTNLGKLGKLGNTQGSWHGHVGRMGHVVSVLQGRQLVQVRAHDAVRDSFGNGMGLLGQLGMRAVLQAGPAPPKSGGRGLGMWLIVIIVIAVVLGMFVLRVTWRRIVELYQWSRLQRARSFKEHVPPAKQLTSRGEGLSATSSTNVKVTMNPVLQKAKSGGLPTPFGATGTTTGDLILDVELGIQRDNSDHSRGLTTEVVAESADSSSKLPSPTKDESVDAKSDSSNEVPASRQLRPKKRMFSVVRSLGSCGRVHADSPRSEPRNSFKRHHPDSPTVASEGAASPTHSVTAAEVDHFSMDSLPLNLPNSPFSRFQTSHSLHLDPRRSSASSTGSGRMGSRSRRQQLQSFNAGPDPAGSSETNPWLPAGENSEGMAALEQQLSKFTVQSGDRLRQSGVHTQSQVAASFEQFWLHRRRAYQRRELSSQSQLFDDLNGPQTHYYDIDNLLAQRRQSANYPGMRGASNNKALLSQSICSPSHSVSTTRPTSVGDPLSSVASPRSSQFFTPGNARTLSRTSSLNPLHHIERHVPNMPAILNISPVPPTVSPARAGKADQPPTCLSPTSFPPTQGVADSATELPGSLRPQAACTCGRSLGNAESAGRVACATVVSGTEASVEPVTIARQSDIGLAAQVSAELHKTNSGGLDAGGLNTVNPAESAPGQHPTAQPATHTTDTSSSFSAKPEPAGSHMSPTPCAYCTACTAVLPAGAVQATGGSTDPVQSVEVVPHAKAPFNPNPAIPALKLVDLDFDLGDSGVLGKGANGCVFKGSYQGKPVAVKVVSLHVKHRQDKQLMQLSKEAKVLAQVKHQHIVHLHGASLHHPWALLVEELMEFNLSDYIHKRGPGRHMTVREALLVGKCVASALCALHPYIVHRDLKPQNVLLSQDGRVKLADFGLAFMMDTEQDLQANFVAGTLPYIAPECFLGDDHRVTPKADIYSLGIMLCECLTQERPWMSLDKLAIAHQVVNKQARPKLPTGSQCPEELRSLIQYCWHQDPLSRPSAEQVYEQLSHIELSLKLTTV